MKSLVASGLPPHKLLVCMLRFLTACPSLSYSTGRQAGLRADLLTCLPCRAPHPLCDGTLLRLKRDVIFLPSARAAEPGASIHSLPDHLLARCFLLVPKRLRRAVLAQTCKRWRRVAEGSGELWTHRDLYLQGRPWQHTDGPNQNWVRLLQWHSSRGEAIHSLAVKASGSGLPCLPALLACLGPGKLQHLDITLKDSALLLRNNVLLPLHCACMASIACFAQLRKLVLRNWVGGISYSQADAIGALTRLEVLDISMGRESAWDPRSWAEDGFFSDTTDEDSDAELLSEENEQMAARFSARLARLTRLHTLCLRGSWPPLPALAQLTGLQRLHFACFNTAGLPEGITNLRVLSGLTVLNRMGTTARSAIRHATSLPALRCLRLMDRAFPDALASLTGLTSLELRVGRIPQDRVEEEFWAVLPRLQQLRRLHLEVMHLEMLPEALVQVDHLTELRLERCSLPGLPRGAYLANLQVLSLTGNNMQRLPQALAAASKLEALDVSEVGLQLSRAGRRLLFELANLRLVRALAAPHVDAGAPLRLADELYKVSKARSQEMPGCPLEVQVSRRGGDDSSDSESDAFSAEGSASDSDAESASTF